MRHRKFIIVKDSDNKCHIRIGYPFYHKDLIYDTDQKNHITCVGGGSWLLDDDNKIITLYGSSSDFGAPSKGDVEDAIKNITEHDWRHITMVFEWVYEDAYPSLAEFIDGRWDNTTKDDYNFILTH